MVHSDTQFWLLGIEGFTLGKDIKSDTKVTIAIVLTTCEFNGVSSLFSTLPTHKD